MLIAIMNFALLNPWMLAGLAGIALPVLAHFLSKKRYDLVHWGAMQFLELGQETRRRVWLEDLWLLLLRMAFIVWIAIALARPWVSAKWLGDIGPQPNRDLVLIIDGSYSMAWESTSVTPQQAAVRWAEKFLGDVRAGDTVAVIEAREQVRPLIEPATRDMNRVRDVLKNLSPPTSSGNLPEAFAYAVKLLSRRTHLRREVVLLTDGQAQGWFQDDANLWLRVDDLAKQSSIPPKLWVVNVLHEDDESKPPIERLNFHVERLTPTRELTVPGFPVRFQTKVRYSGGSASVTRQVHFEVDGQRLADRTISVALSPDGEANVEFEHRFEAVGSHLVRVTLDADDLPTDNSSEAVVVVADALPVLIVDGDPRAESVQDETFFLRAALSAGGNDTPWVKPTIVKWSEWNPKPPPNKVDAQEADKSDKKAPPKENLVKADAKQGPIVKNELDQYSVVVLANVPQLNEPQLAVVTDYVQRGGGLGIALGNRVEKDRYATGLLNAKKGVLDLTLTEIESEPPEHREEGVFLSNATLDAPWLQRFRAERGAALTTARFSRWWKIELPLHAKPDAIEQANGAAEKRPDLNLLSIPDAKLDDLAERKPATVLARLQTGVPYLVSGQFGKGQVLLLTVPLDADWCSLPAKPDFVPFVHEVIFQLAARRGDRNVKVGETLVCPLVEIAKGMNAKSDDFVFESPDAKLHLPKFSGDETTPLAVLNDTVLPGVYMLRRKGPTDDALLTGKEAPTKIPAEPINAPKPLALGPGRELFAVNADRAESNLTPLNDEQITTLTADERMRFIHDAREIRLAASNELPRHELWQLLLLAFLGLLIFEVLMTRRLVKGGHVDTDSES
ncbi:MAG: VWA domain-containing protein [Planctomycetia bacterium]|nr:VWA domain-containing protein [Planctomycetia bacterium]